MDLVTSFFPRRNPNQETAALRDKEVFETTSRRENVWMLCRVFLDNWLGF